MYENYHLYRRMHIYTFVWGNQKVLYKLIPQNILICYPKKDGKSLIKVSTNNLEKGLQVSWYIEYRSKPIFRIANSSSISKILKVFLHTLRGSLI